MYFVKLRYVISFFYVTFHNHIQISVNQSKTGCIRYSRENSIGRIILEIRRNISFFILRSIGSGVTSSRCGEEGLQAKMYPTHICKYPVVAVKGLIKI